MKIVIVDSSRVGLKIMSKMLEGHGHEIICFQDGQEAFDFLCSDSSINVLLTGLELPSKSGNELCWDLRLLAQGGKQIYIIAMSSNHEESKLTETLDSGADDFVTKPPRVQELLARLRVAQRMQVMQDELVKLASLDSLTGILNRRAFFDKAETLCKDADNGENLCAIMLDIDHFKKVNDKYGHDVGDQALLAVVKAAQREFGLFARMGGEEFAMLLPRVTRSEAMDVAEHLRHDIEALKIEAPAEPLRVTCSFGVSEWHNGDSIEALLKRSDLALYDAKENGRNQVQFCEEDISGVVPERSIELVAI